MERGEYYGFEYSILPHHGIAHYIKTEENNDNITKVVWSNCKLVKSNVSKVTT